MSLFMYFSCSEDCTLYLWSLGLCIPEPSQFPGEHKEVLLLLMHRPECHRVVCPHTCCYICTGQLNQDPVWCGLDLKPQQLDYYLAQLVVGSNPPRAIRTWFSQLVKVASARAGQIVAPRYMSVRQQSCMFPWELRLFWNEHAQ